MGSKHHWDFNCPQYVDFLAGLDNNSEDIYFDCADNFSPGDGRAWRNLPTPVNGLTEEAENKLVDKMTAALSIIECTPKIKTGIHRGKLFSEKAPVKHVETDLVKPTTKSSTVLRPSVRLRSKSVYVVNKVHIDKTNKVKEFKPKRSSSLNDLRAMKKHTYPKTPLCLKRTINAKHKVLKSSEEIELEQIAVLQKQLTQLLRNNEISYKKMKLRQKPCKPKNFESKSEIPKRTAGINIEKNMRQNIHAMGHTAMRQTTLKLDSIINNKESTAIAPRNICKDILAKSKNPSISSCSLSVDFEKSREQVPKKHVNYGFHSGLKFTCSSKKNNILKSSILETTVKDITVQNNGTNQKNEVSVKRSVSKDNVNSGKENIPVIKPEFVIKKMLPKVIIDAKQLATNKKKLEQRNKNPLRSLPLAENRARN